MGHVDLMSLPFLTTWLAGWLSFFQLQAAATPHHHLLCAVLDGGTLHFQETHFSAVTHNTDELLVLHTLP